MLTDTKSSDLATTFSAWRTETEIINMDELPKVGLAPTSSAEPMGNVEESHEIADPANSNQRRSAKERLGKRKSAQDRLQHNKKKY